MKSVAIICSSFWVFSSFAMIRIQNYTDLSINMSKSVRSKEAVRLVITGGIISKVLDNQR